MNTTTEKPVGHSPLPWLDNGNEITDQSGRSIGGFLSDADNALALKAVSAHAELVEALTRLIHYSEAARDVIRLTEHKRWLDKKCAPIEGAKEALAKLTTT